MVIVVFNVRASRVGRTEDGLGGGGATRARAVAARRADGGGEARDAARRSSGPARGVECSRDVFLSVSRAFARRLTVLGDVLLARRRALGPIRAIRLWSRPDVAKYVAEMTASGSFVHQMATGELPREKYLRYLSQDAYFLFHFNRAYAQALRLAADVEEQRVFHELIGGVLDELKLHAAACEKWGVDLRAVEVHAASRAYVEFLESLHAKSLLELVAGMIPCMRLYAYVGRYFVTRADADVDGSPDPRTSPYAEWFEAYGGGRDGVPRVSFRVVITRRNRRRTRRR